MISIIIPTKNRSQELQRAIQSVLRQTIQEFEILVIDDYSSEDIASVVYSFKDDKLHYLKNNAAISNANVCRNIGLQAAKGQYVAMLDSDDEWMPDHLEKKIDFIESQKVDGVFGSY